MKKVLIALLAVIGLTISAQAQTSLQFGYGGYTRWMHATCTMVSVM